MIRSEAGGALVGFRLESPQHMAFGAVADRYVNVAPGSCRTYELVETESAQWSDYVWNDGKSLYNLYRETVNFSAIESLSVWLQNLPPGVETKLYLASLEAIPLCTATTKNPKLSVAGKVIEFPVELASGSWIECNGPDDCTVYGSKGETLRKITPHGEWPMLGTGVTSLKFSCEEAQEANPRARVTVFSLGEEL